MLFKAEAREGREPIEFRAIIEGEVSMRGKALAWVGVWFAAVVCLSSLVWAADAPTGDLAKLQGKWKGMAGPEKTVSLLMEFKDTTVMVRFSSPDGQDFLIKGKIKIDEKADPKTMDWVEFVGADGDALPDSKSIYAVDGDTLRVCSNGPDGERPKEFKDGAGAPPMLMSLTRVKDDDSGKKDGR